ncbi:hypothetical protein VBH15_07585, partial [Vagococcus fluvialis]|uniref:hypothetical protein n=1 Tax=Vagococcus fluvialis TaxID=2738 RepID=UPI0037D3D835
FNFNGKVRMFLLFCKKIDANEFLHPHQKLYNHLKRSCDILTSQLLFYKLSGVTEVASTEISRKSQKFEKQFS